MKRIHSKPCHVCLSAAIAVLTLQCFGPVAHAAATTQASKAPQMSPEVRAANVAFTAEYLDIGNKMMQPGVLGDPQRRAALAQTLVPMIHEDEGKLEQLAKLDPTLATTLPSVHRRLKMYLAALGDADATALFQRDAADKDPAIALDGKINLMKAQWLQAGDDAKSQEPLAKSALEMAKDFPRTDAVTVLLLNYSASAASSDLKKKLDDVAVAMDSNFAKHRKLSMEAESTLNGKAGHALVLAGKTPAGAAFTTESLKGHVILIDFWATWCGPCKAELPRVKAMYEKYHDKGFDVVGVSNDYSAEALRSYTADNALPWPQLFDAEAAQQQSWHPLTEQMGIGAIPVMMLIDKHGVCRSVTARDDMETLVPKLLAEG